MIREVVDDRRMPPWHADPRYGHFENDRSLTSPQRATLLAWVDQDAPLGDAQGRPRPTSLPRGLDDRHARPRDRDARALSACRRRDRPLPVFPRSAPASPRTSGSRPPRPDPAIPRSSTTSWSRSTITRRGPKEEGDRLPRSHFVAYAPGDLPLVLPPGTAKRIPAGSDFIIQMHYTPVGKVRTDRSSIAVIFAKEPPRHEAHTLGIIQQDFEIPAGADNYPVRSTYVFPADGELYSLFPHMHLRGKSFRYTATFPDGYPGDSPVGPGVRLRLAERLPPGRAPLPAQGDPDRLPGALRQFSQEPGQSRPVAEGRLG